MKIPLQALRRALAEAARDSNRGASFGLAAGALPTGYDELTDEDPGFNSERFVGNALGGALLGSGAGFGVGAGVRTMVRGANGLRQALAVRAAERGMGRAAMREVSDAGDAARFMGSMSRGGYLDEASAVRVLARLRQERAMATNAGEIADLDDQIAALIAQSGV